MDKTGREQQLGKRRADTSAATKALVPSGAGQWHCRAQNPVYNGAAARFPGRALHHNYYYGVSIHGIFAVNPVSCTHETPIFLGRHRRKCRKEHGVDPARQSDAPGIP